MYIAEIRQELARLDPSKTVSDRAVRTLIGRLETKGYALKTSTEPPAYQALVPREKAFKLHVNRFLDQYALGPGSLDLARTVVEMRLESQKSNSDSSRLLSRIIQTEPSPMVKGTSVTVDSLLAQLASGCSIEDILAEHEELAREDVQAAVAFARMALTSARMAS